MRKCNALKSILAAIALGLATETVSAFDQSFNDICANLCTKQCELKEYAPGLYRSECMNHCIPNCLWKHIDDAAAGTKKSPKQRKNG
jgi:hypothetical protein